MNTSQEVITPPEDNLSSVSFNIFSIVLLYLNSLAGHGFQVSCWKPGNYSAGEENGVY